MRRSLASRRAARAALFAWAIVAPCALLSTREARASGSWFPTETTRVPIGLNLGAAGGGGRGTGLLLGGELSVVHWMDGLWFGGYVDMLRDFTRRSSRFSAGGEIGYWLVGMDAGFVHDLSNGTSGYRVRGLVSVSVVSLYAGGGELFGGGTSTGFVEVGALLKWAIIERADGSGWRLGIP